MMMGFVMGVIGKWSKVVVFAPEPAFYYLWGYIPQPPWFLWHCSAMRNKSGITVVFFVLKCNLSKSEVSEMYNSSDIILIKASETALSDTKANVMHNNNE